MDKKSLFKTSMLLATLVPFLFFIAKGAYGNPLPAGADFIAESFYVFAALHVPATVMLLADPDFYEVRKGKNLRFFAIPIFLGLATGTAYYFLSDAAAAFLLLFFWAWQALHYGNQNIGVYAFISAADGKKFSLQERTIIQIGTALGIIGTFKSLGYAAAPAILRPSIDQLYLIGQCLSVVFLVPVVAVFLKHRKEMTLTKGAFYFALAGFFLPMYLSSDSDINFWSYAAAHGFQYFVFILIATGFVLTTSQSRALKIGLFLVFSILFLAPQLRTQVSGFDSFFKFLIGALIGLTMGHFVIDAASWKLRFPQQRIYIIGKFPFVFKAAS